MCNIGGGGNGGEQTIVGDTLEGLLVQVAPVEVEAVQPRWDTALLEGGGVFVSILLLHGGEAGDAQVGEVLAVGAVAVLIL